MPIYERSARASPRNLEDSDDDSAHSFETDNKSNATDGLSKANQDQNMPKHEQFKQNVFEANEENILSDALYIYDYINKIIGIDEENLIVFGRSIGSGPATHVASRRKPSCLLLMSAFKSIRAIA